MMTPEELVAYMEEVAAQCPDDILEGDVYTMVHFGIELGKLSELEKIVEHLEILTNFVRAVERKGMRLT